MNTSANMVTEKTGNSEEELQTVNFQANKRVKKTLSIYLLRSQPSFQKY